MTRWLLCAALLFSGCTVGPKVRKYAVAPDYERDARNMPFLQAQELLHEVLDLARGDNPNRRNDPVEPIEVHDHFFEVVAFCYDAAGNRMGRPRFKRAYILLAPQAYEVHIGDEPVVYFVKLDGAYDSSFKVQYPSLQIGCLWFENPAEVEALFKAIACLKEKPSSD